MAGNRVLLAALALAICVAAVAGLLLLRTDPLPSAPQEAIAPDPAVPVTGASAGAARDGFVILDPAPDIAALMPLDPAGRPADMGPFRGKALLVNFWATWCAPCIQELPALARLQTMLGGPDFAVVTIALDEVQPAKVADFLAEHGAGSLPALIDGNRTIDEIMPIAALPTSLLVDKAGKVRAAFTGDATWDCGKALEAVRAFVAASVVVGDELETCE